MIRCRPAGQTPTRGEQQEQALVGQALRNLDPGRGARIGQGLVGRILDGFQVIKKEKQAPLMLFD